MAHAITAGRDVLFLLNWPRNAADFSELPCCDLDRGCEELVRPCAWALDAFLGELFARPFDADWREQWHAFIDEWRPTGRMNDAASLCEFEIWIEAWAMHCGLLPDDGRYRMLQENGMWVAYRAAHSIEQPAPPADEGAGERASSVVLAAYHPPTKPDARERLDASERVVPRGSRCGWARRRLTEDIVYG